jgi:sortase (surface protein transpeptidase)
MDEPLLVPQLAPPTPVPALAETALPSLPVRLVIPAIGLDVAPVAVGLDDQGVPIVPKHDVGWYDRSAAPGQNSNVVFWGHVLRWREAPDIPAPFARVHELQPGAELILVTADGQQRNYRVAAQIQVRPDQVEYIDPTPSERVTLVSCIGDKVVVDGTLTKEFRLLTLAEPVE